MKKSIIALIGAAVLIFFFFLEKPEKKHTVFIQYFLDSPTLETVKDTITPAINRIVKEELGLAADFEFDFFLPKKRQALTLYYVDAMKETGDSVLFAELEKIIPTLTIPENVVLSPAAHYFGDADDELVIMANDTNGELSRLHQHIKEMAHQANEQYAAIHHQDLYDIARSERFPYTPHIGLGRLRINSIKQQIKDQKQDEKMLERIKLRTLQSAQEIVEKLVVPANQKLIFKSELCVFDPAQHTCIKEYSIHTTTPKFVAAMD